MAMQVKVGSFAKSITTGSQAVTGIGFQPKAIILFHSWALAAGFASGAYQSVGVSTGTTESFCATTASANGAPDGTTARRTAAKIMSSIASDATTVYFEADLSSFDTDGFTLNWTTNNASAVIINYIALGGTDLTNAKAISWTTPVTAIDKAVTGVGFKPDCVMHMYTYDTSAVVSTTHAVLSLGAMDKEGNQWTSGFLSLNAVTITDTQRFQFTDACLATVDSALAVPQKATFKSMDTDGFTTNFPSTSGTLRYVISLCLKGGSYKVGNFTAPPANQTGPQRLDGIGFRPKGALFSGCRYILNNYVQGNMNNWSISATSGPSASKGIAVSDLNAVDVTTAGSYQADKAIVGLNNPSALGYAADLSSFDADGLSIEWTTMVNFNNLGIVYLAVGDA